jgi:methyl-accepting chemotaxis protein
MHSINKSAFLLSSLVVLITSSILFSVYAQNPVILTDQQGQYPLGLHLEILEDPQKQWTIEEVNSAEFAGRFKPSQDAAPNFGFTNSAYWIRLQVKNEAAATSGWLLEYENPTMNVLDLYLAPADCQPLRMNVTGACSVVFKHAGDNLPFAAREIPYRYFVFRLPLKPQTTYTLYLHFENADVMTFPLTLWSSEAFIQKLPGEHVGIGMFYGALLIMAGYNLFLFLTLRDKSTGYYILFILLYALFQASGDDGLAMQYLWPNQIWWNHLAVPLFASLVLGAALMFTHSFLLKDIPRSKLHAVFKILWAATALLIVVVPFVRLHIIFPPLVILALTAMPIMLLTGMVSWRHGYRPARYFLLAWTVFLTAMFVRMLTNLTILPANVLAQYGDRIGAVLMMLLLSLALADRVRTVMQEKEHTHLESLQLKEDLNVALQNAKEELEARVAAQTAKLELANAEIQTLNLVMRSAEQLGGASSGLTQISTQIAAEAEQTSQQIGLISSNSHQMSQSIHDVSVSTEEVASNIREIAQTITKVTEIVTNAVNIANTANTTITGLETHSQEIGDISKVITNIAQQTNLLALNATIEAARAGELGRGFTVVANEVKDLARETSKSAEDITRKIETIQGSSQEAASAITEVVKIIEQVAVLSNTISKAIVEQTDTTNRISRTITDAAHGSEEITRTIADLATTVQDSSARAANVQKEAQELAALAEQLRHLVEIAKSKQRIPIAHG